MTGLSRAWVTVIRSYPCYEFWLLLHFRYTRKPYEQAGKFSPADQLVRDLKKEEGMQNYDKSSFRCFSYLLPRMTQAMQHAARSLKDAEQVGEMNPSTEMHILLEELKALAELTPAGG
jgi:hypothetical protein